MNLNDYITKLAVARKVLTEYKAEKAELDAEIAALVAEKYGKAQERIDSLLETARADVDDAEAAVRVMALDAYKQTGDKHPHDAVQIRVYTRLDYDQEMAFRYCTEHLTTALKMNARKFEKVAKAAELDFVDFIEDPRPTVARDLSAYEQYWQEESL